LQQNSVKHLRRKASGLRVLLTGMIAGEKKRQICGQREFRSMGKPVRGSRDNFSAMHKQAQVGVEGDGTECQNGARF
jgi:hypothetical protein